MLHRDDGHLLLDARVDAVRPEFERRRPALRPDDDALCVKATGRRQQQTGEHGKPEKYGKNIAAPGADDSHHRQQHSAKYIAAGGYARLAAIADYHGNTDYQTGYSQQRGEKQCL